MTKKELHDFIENNQPNICQIVGYKDNVEVYSDEWNDYKKNDTCHVMSVTKSIVSILIGIAIDQGLIKSVDQHILEFFPQYSIKRGEKTIQEITIKHLLTMKAPLKCKYDPWTKVCISEDWTLSSLDFIGGRKGITNEFKYNTVCLHVLTGIIAKVSGMTPTDFANRYLFEPLNISKRVNYLVLTAEEHKSFTVQKKSKGNVWFCDPKGVGLQDTDYVFQQKN